MSDKIDDKALFKGIFESSVEGILVVDETGTIIKANPTSEAMFGYDTGELKSKKVEDLVPKNVREIHKNHRTNYTKKPELRKMGQGRDLQGRRKNGSQFPLEISLSPSVIGGTKVTIAFIIDITQRKEVEQNLIMSEATNKAILEAIPDLMFVVNKERKYVDVHSPDPKKLALMKEMLVGKSIYEQYTNELKEKITVAFDHVERTEESHMLEYTYYQDDKAIHYEARIVLKDASHFLVILRDVTEQKKAQEDLYIRNRALESAVNGIIITDAKDPKHPIIYFNEAFEKTTGYSKDEILGNNCRFLQGDDRDQSQIKAMAAAIENSEPCTVTLRNYRKDGSLFWNEVTITPVLSDKGETTHFIGIQNDVTLRKRQEILDERSTKVLELIAKRESLPVIAEFVVNTIETMAPDMKASILMFDQEKGVLNRLAAPSLPKAYSDSVEGVMIGPNVGSCGKTAFSKKEVLVTDIATDPLWKDFKHLILPHGLNSCWSIPIFAPNGSVLGTFALYSSQTITPSKKVRERILNTCKLISIAIEQYQADMRIKESNRKYRHLIDNLPGVAYRSMPDDYWSMQYISDQILALTGYPPEVFEKPTATLSYNTLIHPEDREKVRETVVNAIAKREPYEILYRIKTKQNKEKWILANGSGVFNTEGQLLFLEGFAMDRTEGIKAEQSLKKSEQILRNYASELEDKVQERTNELSLSVHKLVNTNTKLELQITETETAQALYSTIAEHFPNGIIVVANNDLQLVSIYGEDLDLLNLDKKMIEGFTIDEILVFPDDFKINLKNSVEKTLKGEHLSFEIKLKGIDYAVNSMPLFFGQDGAELALFVYTNISKQKEVEKEIFGALQKEKDLNELKSRFVSMASHEFRTPLSTILSSATLISKQNGPGLEEKRERYVIGIKHSVKNMVAILNDFLSLGKLEEGKITISPSEFDIVKFSKGLIEEMGANIKSGQYIDLIVDMPEILVTMDEKLVRHILLNLLSNAVKYSPEEKKIILAFKLENENLFINVIDEGMGIPEDEQANLFERFFRARNATNIDGTGLGMHIVKKYVELMDGSIDFTSKLYEGTRFSVLLPIRQKEHEISHDNF